MKCSGAGYLVEGVICFPSSSLANFLGENLDHVGWTMVAPVVLLPSLRHHLGSSTGCSGDPSILLVEVLGLGVVAATVTVIFHGEMPLNLPLFCFAHHQFGCLGCYCVMDALPSC